ncbi:hypothetical protein ACT7DD_14910 [Bacillus paranthracis]
MKKEKRKKNHIEGKAKEQKRKLVWKKKEIASLIGGYELLT